MEEAVNDRLADVKMDPQHLARRPRVFLVDLWTIFISCSSFFAWKDSLRSRAPQLIGSAWQSFYSCTNFSKNLKPLRCPWSKLIANSLHLIAMVCLSCAKAAQSGTAHPFRVRASVSETPNSSGIKAQEPSGSGPGLCQEPHGQKRKASGLNYI